MENKNKKPQCKHIKDNGTQCGMQILLSDGFCIWHSPTPEGAELRKKWTKRNPISANVSKEKLAKKFNLPHKNPMVMIRHHCIHCSGDSVKVVMFCQITSCPLWYLRFGAQARAYVNVRGEECAKLFDKKNFDEGGIYGPDIEIEKLRQV